MARCVGVTKAGTQCKREAIPGSTTCHQHIASVAAVAAVPTCQHHKECERQSVIVIHNRRMCAFHLSELQKNTYSAFIHQIERIARNPMTQQQRHDYVAQVLHTIIMLEDEHRLNHSQVERLRDLIERRLAPPPPAAPANLALDPQNVHTTTVVKQTNCGLDVLLAIENAPAAIDAIYDQIHLSQAVADDIKKWYNTTSCKSVNDWLYRRAVNGLWSLIQASTHKEELLKRFVEEATESVGMCCEGHMSRLANVMVGFDSRFAPPVPKGELVQQRMAAIAMMDVTDDEKRVAAAGVLDELQVPVAERAAWLDGLTELY